MAQGGSWDGLPSLLALNAPENKRGWYAMLGQLGAPVGFLIAAGLFSYLLTNLSSDDFLVWGWRYPFYVAFAINVVALFARLRLVSTTEYTHLLDAHELDPAPVVLGRRCAPPAGRCRCRTSSGWTPSTSATWRSWRTRTSTGTTRSWRSNLRQVLHGQSPGWAADRG